MNSTVRVTLDTTPEQAERLRQLQASFAHVCNALAPVVQERRCWNRVTLHHLTYRAMRDAFPQMGSQMVCNAIYAVCRAARLLFQEPASPLHLSRLPGGKLPLLRFTEDCPVYFDRHTLSLKGGQLSMYTLDGRMRFQLQVTPQHEARFREQRLRETYLSRRADTRYELVFCFAEGEHAEDLPAALPLSSARGEIPPYVSVEERA